MRMQIGGRSRGSAPRQAAGPAAARFPEVSRVNRVSAVLSCAVLLGGLSTAGAQQTPLTVLSADGFDAFGQRMNIAGDVNGDGIDDYVVGAPKADPQGDRSGQARVFSG